MLLPPVSPLPDGCFRVRRAVLAIGLTLAASTLLGAPDSRAAEGGISQLKRFIATTPAASGRFTQSLIKEGGKAARPSTGVFAYAKPGRFRWEIQKPYEQLIVTDGTALYFYDKDLQQVTVKPVSEAMSATPAALLFGTSDIDKSFRLSDDGQSGDLAWVQAVPTSKEAGFERLRIAMRGGLPVRMEVNDAFGQQTRFEFDGIDPKASVPATQFHFTPPPGVDVVR